MMETQVHINITHFPNGDQTPEYGNHILHLMPDGSVIGAPFGPTVLTAGKKVGNSIRFEWYHDRPDIAGHLEINEIEFSSGYGVGYSGCCYKQSMPSDRKDSIKEWMELFEERVEFQVIVSDDIAQFLQNRKVCDVTEYYVNNSTYGRIKSWRGSVEKEYFSIVFVGGVLSVSLEEREYKIGTSSINYAMSLPLIEATNKVCNVSESEKIDAAKNYNKNVYPSERELLKFSDVMKILKWKFNSTNVKVDHNDFFLDE